MQLKSWYSIEMLHGRNENREQDGVQRLSAAKAMCSAQE